MFIAMPPVYGVLKLVTYPCQLQDLWPRPSTVVAYYCTAILASTREGQHTKSHVNFERAEASNLFKTVQSFRSCARRIECMLLGGILVLQRSQRRSDTRGETNSTSFVTRLRATPPTDVLSSHSPTLSPSHDSTSSPPPLPISLAPDSLIPFISPLKEGNTICCTS
jgi:hypothetical protein